MANFFGFFIAILSAIANGTFTVPSKLEPAKSSGTDSNVFNLYVGIGIAFSCFIIPFIAGIPLSFTWLGIVAGFILSISSMHAFAAVKLVGVSVASGIWCGVAVVVAFLFGYIFEEPVSNLFLALCAIALLVVSICGIAYAEKAATESEESAGLLESGDAKGPFNLPHRFIKGIGAAIIAGIFGGLVLAPETYAPTEATGLKFIFSFGIGTLISSPIVNLAPFAWQRTIPQFHPKESALLGLLGGIIWNTSNVCSIIAIQEIGYSIAYPLMQCGLFVSGLWGILLFHEIQGPAQKYYWISGIVLIAGAVMLNFSK